MVTFGLIERDTDNLAVLFAVGKLVDHYSGHLTLIADTSYLCNC